MQGIPNSPATIVTRLFYVSSGLCRCQAEDSLARPFSVRILVTNYVEPNVRAVGKRTSGFCSGGGFRPLICAIEQSLTDICLSRRPVVAKLLSFMLGGSTVTVFVLMASVLLLA